MNNRLKILKHLYLTSTAETIQPQSGPADQKPVGNTNPEVTPPQSGPTPKPVVAPKPVQPVADASKDFQAKGTEPAKPAATTEVKPLETKTSSLYDIVKSAVYEKIYNKAIEHYSYDMNQFKAKTIFKTATPLAVKKLGKESLEVRFVLSGEALENIVKTGAVSFYEPVREYTDFFRIKFAKSIKEQDLSYISIIAKKINNIGFETTLKKSRTDGSFILECSSIDAEKMFDTNEIFKKAYNLTKSIAGTNLSDLIFGKLKRCAFSLDDLGNDDIIIDIGE